MMDRSAEIRVNYLKVLERVDLAAQRSGRDAKGIRLVVVTKGHSPDSINAVIEAGSKHLGENYVEEALPKIKGCTNFEHIVWHMVGHVQSRKARQVCESFEWLHSLDSMRLASRLNGFSQEVGRRMNILLECNVSAETTKFGFPAWEEKRWPELADQLLELESYHGLHICGLMTMAPFSNDPESSRPYYKRLTRLQKYLGDHIKSINWCELSMGMSADFEVAIQEGATLVRIGEAIMGKRPG